jgi:hypothetical protein
MASEKQLREAQGRIVLVAAGLVKVLGPEVAAGVLFPAAVSILTMHKGNAWTAAWLRDYADQLERGGPPPATPSLN